MWQPSGAYLTLTRAYLTLTQQSQVNGRRLAIVHRMWRWGKAPVPIAHMDCQVHLRGKTSKLHAELKKRQNFGVALRGATIFF